MKGVALPIEVLVVIVIAVIVLLGMVAVYFAGWTPFAETAGVDAVKNNACRKLAYNCSKSTTLIYVTGMDVDGDGNTGATATGSPVDANDNLQLLCSKYYDIDLTDEKACKRICGCV